MDKANPWSRCCKRNSLSNEGFFMILPPQYFDVVDLFICQITSLLYFDELSIFEYSKTEFSSQSAVYTNLVNFRPLSNPFAALLLLQEEQAFCWFNDVSFSFLFSH